jgi:hypothetical protein
MCGAVIPSMPIEKKGEAAVARVLVRAESGGERPIDWGFEEPRVRGYAGLHQVMK